MLRAMRRKAAPFIMIFAPVTPDQDICLDLDGERKEWLKVEHICDLVRKAAYEYDNHIPVTLMTPSPLTGGWSCRSLLLGQGQGGAYFPDIAIRMVARSCGGAFAHRLAESFTQRDTPLFSDAQRRGIQVRDYGASLMPTQPTAQQTALLYQVQAQIHESLRQRMKSRLARQHALIVHPKGDAWSVTYNRWPMSGAPAASASPSADRYFKFLGDEAFGGCRTTQLFHLKYLAAIELETCPGDWTRGADSTTRNLLSSFLQNPNPGEGEVKRVFDVLEFRASSIILAQSLAKALSLPLPDGGCKCRYWHDRVEVEGMDERYYSRLQAAFGEAHNLFDRVADSPGSEYKSTARFARASRWLSAAIATGFSDGAAAVATNEQIKAFVLGEVARLVERIREEQVKLLMQDQDVVRAGRRWIDALIFDFDWVEEIM
jgi:hypothetical protein